MLGASLGLLSILIHSVVDFNMQIPANAVTAITLMALLTAHWRFGTERFWVNPGKSENFCWRSVAAGAAGFLGREGAPGGPGILLAGARVERGSRGNRQVAGLKKAQQIEPGNFMTRL